jgi:hypothetical protein
VASNTAFAFGASDYTVEGWLYSLATTQQVFFASGGTGTNNFYFSFAPASSYIGVGNQSVFILQATGLTLSTGVWYHVAASRASGTLKLFLNGVQVASGADGTSWIQGGSTSVGNNSQGSQYFSGYISNLRIVKGTAVYTGAFAPPTGFLTTTGGTYSSTTNVNTSITASNTSLLVNLGDSNYTSATNAVQNNTFIDTGPYAFTITRNGTPTQGSVTPYWPNGQWSNYFSPTTDYLSVASSTGLAFGTGDFTVEGWVYAQSTAQFNLLTLTATFQFFVSNNLLYIYDNGTQTSGGTITSNTWQHIAIARSGTAMKCFINGTQVISVSSSTAFTQGTNQVANNTGSSYGAGYVQDLRVTKGVARYTATFTAPTAAFPTR